MVVEVLVGLQEPMALLIEAVEVVVEVTLFKLLVLVVVVMR